MRRKCDFKKVDITHSLESFLGSCFHIAATGFLKLQQKDFHGRKSTEWKNVLIPQYLVECCLLYSTVEFLLFYQVLWPFNMCLCGKVKLKVIFVSGILMPFRKLQSLCPISLVATACCKDFGRSSLARVK